LPEVSGFGDIIEAIRATYDVDHVSYYALSLGVDAQPREFVGQLPTVDGTLRQGGRSLAAVSYAPDWIARYVEAKFVETDPVMNMAFASFDPIDWSELDWGGNRNQQFLNEANEFGIGNQGYSVPVRGPGGQFAVFTINKTCRSEVWLQLLNTYRTDFLLLAHFTHQQMLKMAGKEHTHPKRPLSNRERDAVRLIADGLSRGQAADKLGISENTFRVYIDSARHKLGALNVPHAVALASHRGLIAPN